MAKKKNGEVAFSVNKNFTRDSKTRKTKETVFPIWVKECFKEVKELYPHIPEKMIENAFKSQFMFVSDMTKSADRFELDTYKSVSLLYFGRFFPNERMVNKVIELYKDKKKDEEPI